MNSKSAVPIVVLSVATVATSGWYLTKIHKAIATPESEPRRVTDYQYNADGSVTTRQYISVRQPYDGRMGGVATYDLQRRLVEWSEPYRRVAGAPNSSTTIAPPPSTLRIETPHP